MNSVFYTVLGLSLTGGLTCLVIFAASALSRNRIPKSWHYFLWLAAILRFVMPFSLNLPFSIPVPVTLSDLASIAEHENSYSYETNMHLPAITGANTVNSPNVIPVSESNTAGIGFDILSVSAMIWLIGACTIFLWYLIGYIVTLKKLRENRISLSSGRVRVYESEKVSTPILVGLIHPAIYLPKDFCRKDLAIRHELCHLRRRDIWIKWIIQIVVCIHWFNPAVYLMRRELNRLAVLACDQNVIKDLNDNERKSYGKMLLETAKSVSGYGGMMFALSGNNKQLLEERIKEIMKNSKITKKVIMTMLVLVLCVVCTATITGAVTLSNDSESAAIDNIDLPFVDDPDIIGTWVSVDFVKNISDFDPTNKYWQGDLYLEGFIFSEKGEMSVKGGGMKKAESFPWLTWTKGVVLNQRMGTASKYEIKDIDGSEYMFFEWKSGDYTIRHMTPFYYVLKYSSSGTIDNNITDTGRLHDNTDLPFVDDPDVIGKWESVDFVRNISDFDPANKSREKYLYLKEFTFSNNGEISVKAGEMKEAKSDPGITWTRGAVLDQYDGTASRYEIKDIDGSEYMFFEWKSGDYTIRHMTPYYYVLKKAD